MALNTALDFVALVLAQEDSNNESIMINGLQTSEIDPIKNAINSAFSGEFVVRMVSTGRSDTTYDPAVAAPDLPAGTKVGIYQFRIKFVNGQSVYFKGWFPQDTAKLDLLKAALLAETATAFTAGSDVESVTYEKKSKY